MLLFYVSVMTAARIAIISARVAGVKIPGFGTIGGLFGGGGHHRVDLAGIKTPKNAATIIKKQGLGSPATRVSRYRYLGGHLIETAKPIRRAANFTKQRLKAYGLTNLSSQVQKALDWGVHTSPSDAIGDMQHLLNVTNSAELIIEGVSKAFREDPEFGEYFKEKTGMGFDVFEKELGRQTDVFMAGYQLQAARNDLERRTKERTARLARRTKGGARGRSRLAEKPLLIGGRTVEAHKKGMTQLSEITKTPQIADISKVAASGAFNFGDSAKSAPTKLAPDFSYEGDVQFGLLPPTTGRGKVLAPPQTLQPPVETKGREKMLAPVQSSGLGGKVKPRVKTKSERRRRAFGSPAKNTMLENIYGQLK